MATQRDILEVLRDPRYTGNRAILDRAADEIEHLRLQVKEGCEAARSFGGEVVGDDDEPKWCVAAAIVADRARRAVGEG